MGGAIAGRAHPFALPPLTETLRALVTGGGEFLRHLLRSLYAIGLSTPAACGIGAGLLIGSIAPVRRVVQPLASGLYAVPLVILYPLFTAWFGIGPQSKIVFASIYGLLPCFLASLLPCFPASSAPWQACRRLAGNTSPWRAA